MRGDIVSGESDGRRRGRHEIERILRVADAAQQMYEREQDGRLSRGVQQRCPRRPSFGRRVSEVARGGAI